MGGLNKNICAIIEVQKAYAEPDVPHLHWLIPFTQPVIGHHRSHFGTSLSWSALVSRLHREGKEFPSLFPAPYSFLQ